MSVWRVAQAFFLATILGVPVGLLLGWSKAFKEYVFPVFELLRPIPVLAWVPLAIVMFTATESAVVYLAFLASFFTTALNTMLGVESIDESYIRAAKCLGANRWQTFRHVIVPGALPFIFTGLQISIGVSWFSLVAAEMVSGQYGLGYVINTSYMMVRYPTIIIGMATLGIVGYTTSALVRSGGLADRTTLFRNDIAFNFVSNSFPKNPHTFLTNIGGTFPVASVAVGAQSQIAIFFATNGALTIDPDGPGGPLFEVPASFLPEDLAFIP